MSFSKVKKNGREMGRGKKNTEPFISSSISLDFSLTPLFKPLSFSICAEKVEGGYCLLRIVSESEIIMK